MVETYYTIAASVVGLLLISGVIWALVTDHIRIKKSIRDGTYHNFIVTGTYTYQCTKCGLSVCTISPDEYLTVPNICNEKK
jgi:hypothetical protein